jgi:enoyl-CoA hydratase/carnithine racemase
MTCQARGMVEVRWQGDVAVVTMDDGENRFDGDHVARWHEVLDEIQAKDGPLAVVTTGAGRFYSNGLDLEWLGSHREDAGPMITDLHRLWGRVLGLDAITVAAVNGHAFGAGALLSSAHDRIVMREDRGYWCMPEVDLGMAVSGGMAALLSATLPLPAVHRMLVTGHRFTGPEAVAAGIAAEIAPADELLDRAIAYAEPLALKSRAVIGTHKRLLHGAAIDRLLAGAS